MALRHVKQAVLDVEAQSGQRQLRLRRSFNRLLGGGNAGGGAAAAPPAHRQTSKWWGGVWRLGRDMDNEYVKKKATLRTRALRIMQWLVSYKNMNYTNLPDDDKSPETFWRTLIYELGGSKPNFTKVTTFDEAGLKAWQDGYYGSMPDDDPRFQIYRAFVHDPRWDALKEGDTETLTNQVVALARTIGAELKPQMDQVRARREALELEARQAREQRKEQARQDAQRAAQEAEDTTYQHVNRVKDGAEKDFLEHFVENRNQLGVGESHNMVRLLSLLVHRIEQLEGEVAELKQQFGKRPKNAMKKT